MKIILLLTRKKKKFIIYIKVDNRNKNGYIILKGEKYKYKIANNYISFIIIHTIKK